MGHISSFVAVHLLISHLRATTCVTMQLWNLINMLIYKQLCCNSVVESANHLFEQAYNATGSYMQLCCYVAAQPNNHAYIMSYVRRHHLYPAVVPCSNRSFFLTNHLSRCLALLINICSYTNMRLPKSLP